jgi:hypothetical protein
MTTYDTPTMTAAETEESAREHRVYRLLMKLMRELGVDAACLATDPVILVAPPTAPGEDDDDPDTERRQWVSVTVAASLNNDG